MSVGDAWASGSWQVTEGKVDEFKKRWEELVGGAKDNIQGFRDAHLLQDLEDPNHFVSVAMWDDRTARAEWMQLPAFDELVGACREVCDDFRGGGYDEVIAL